MEEIQSGRFKQGSEIYWFQYKNLNKGQKWGFVGGRGAHEREE